MDFTRLVQVDPRSPKVYYFPIDRHLLMRDYRSNAMMLEALDSLLRDPRVTLSIDTIEIFGACSPVASEEYNRRLALRRAQALKAYICWKHPDVSEAHPVAMRALGIDHEGYRALKQSGRPLTEKQIWDLLQYATVRLLMRDGTHIHAGSESPVKAIVEDTPEMLIPLPVGLLSTPDTILPPKIVMLPAVAPALTKHGWPLIAVGTNLLYDAAALPNLSVEFSLNHPWSILMQGAWAWWDTREPNYWSYRIQMLWLEGRYWPEDGAPLTGWHAGLYAAIGDYDIRLFPKGPDPLGVLSRSSWSAGLTGGYALPLDRHWRLDFVLGIGYLGGSYVYYNHSRCVDCYPQRGEEKQRRYLGPTQAAVSLVYKISNEK
jgi:hypothetical protein